MSQQSALPVSPNSSTRPPVVDLSEFIEQTLRHLAAKRTPSLPNQPTQSQPQPLPADNSLSSLATLPQQDVVIAGNGLTFRLLQRDDCSKGYVDLLGQLTKVTQDNTAFQAQFDSLNDDYIILVVVNKDTDQIVGTGTLLLERKFIRNFGTVGHIEDVVVSSQVRRCGIGLTLIQTLSELGNRLGCYKTILDCSPDNETFYLHCGFENKGVQMGQYY